MNIQEKKISSAILYFANKSKEKTINRMKLIKLMWLSDRLHLNKFGRLIIKDRYSAMPNGPVPSNTLNMTNDCIEGIYSTKGKYDIIANEDSDLDYFSKSDLEIMDYVWINFGKMDHFALSDFSHEFPEWLRFEDDLKNGSRKSSYEIDLNDFFEEDSSDYDFSNIYTKNDSNLSKESFISRTKIEEQLFA